jgi:hypothetical protein
VTEVGFAVEIDAPPKRVWEVVGDPRNLPHWERHIVDVRGIGPEGLEAGDEYVTVMRFMGIRANVHARVLEWEPPRYSEIRLMGLLDATVITTVRPIGKTRSLLEHRIDYRFRGGPLGEFAARSLRAVGGAQLALRRGALAQKREIESR